MAKVKAIVVTCDRYEMLKNCLEAIDKQTWIKKDDNELDVIVVDNAGIVNSKEKRIKMKGLEKDLSDHYNSGHLTLMTNNSTDPVNGAYGFYTGVEVVVNSESDDTFIWIMDDDVLPEPNALSELINSWDSSRMAFESSFVMFRDTDEPFYKNIPREAKNNTDLFLMKDASIDFQVNFGTFTSMLTTVENVKIAGPVRWDFQIWGDDTEFSERLIYKTGKKGYLVPRSIVQHWAARNDKAVWDIPIGDLLVDSRASRFRYGYRNRVIASYQRNRGDMSAVRGTLKREFEEIHKTTMKLLDNEKLNNRDLLKALQNLYATPRSLNRNVPIVEGVIEGLTRKNVGLEGLSSLRLPYVEDQLK